MSFVSRDGPEGRGPAFIALDCRGQNPSAEMERCMLQGHKLCILLDVPSPFFPGILLSRTPPETQGKRMFFEKKVGWKEWGSNS